MADAQQRTEPEHVAEPEGTPDRRSRAGYATIIIRAARRSMRDHVPHLAQAVAFNTFLAVPSGLLVALGVFTQVSAPSDVSSLIAHLNGVVPASVIQLLDDSLSRARAHGGGEVMILVGGVIALWSLTSAMVTIQWAINMAYEHQTKRGFVRARLVALGMVLCLLVAFSLVVVFQVLGPVMTDWAGATFGVRSEIGWIWWIAQWPVLVAGLLAAFAGILFLGPDIDRRRYRLVTVGSIVATVIWVVASLGFAYYVDNLSSYNKTWGSLSAVIVMLIWLWLTALALLFGAEINAEAERSRGLE